PRRLAVEGAVLLARLEPLLVLARLAVLGRLADHLHVAAQREPRGDVLGLAAPEGEPPAADPDRRAEAQREAQDLHVEELRHQEVAELVDEDQRPQHQDEREQHAERGHADSSAPSRSRARARAQASAASTSSRSRSAPPRARARCSSSSAALVAAMAGKPMRPARNAATETSLAAFSTAGAASSAASAA